MEAIVSTASVRCHLRHVLHHLLQPGPGPSCWKCCHTEAMPTGRPDRSNSDGSLHCRGPLNHKVVAEQFGGGAGGSRGGGRGSWWCRTNEKRSRMLRHLGQWQSSVERTVRSIDWWKRAPMFWNCVSTLKDNNKDKDISLKCLSANNQSWERVEDFVS